MNTIVTQIQTNARNDFSVRLMDTLIDKEYTGDDRQFIKWLEETMNMNMTGILKAIVDWDEQNGLENWDCRDFPYGNVDEIVDEYIIQSDTLSSITI